MAATRALAIGSDNGEEKEASRLGSVSATGRADTWRTFTTAYVNADGSGYVRVERDGETIHEFTFGPEDAS